ncbi:MAG: DUF721 domain-containing protein [Nocardiopsaceae bacterium]|nr:DUF721 domain-containing protein [Nocardiopsaceae bacterium]
MRPDPERVRLASEALARARADAWARGDRPLAAPDRQPQTQPHSISERTEASLPGSLPASWSARTRRDDPQPLNVALGGMLSARGWRGRAAVASVFGRWAQIVGPQVAGHVTPDTFDDGELVVVADSAAWATQMRLLAPQVLGRLGQELGAGTVRRVAVRTRYSPGGGGRRRTPRHGG